jgi:2,4-dienoyl-CoA reductase (NADPH2)
VVQSASFLATPVQINGRTIANRMAMGPMAATDPRADGGPSEQTIAFFEARARGGVGMIIVGGGTATRRAAAECPVKPFLRFEVDALVPDFRRLADAVHAHGTTLIAELSPGFGPMGVPGPGRPNIAASPRSFVIPQARMPRGFRAPGDRVLPAPQEATIEQIREIERDVIASAERVVRAGWDGVEVASHMSYLGSTFLSSRTNWRTDEYGGSAENRARMLTSMVRGIRERVPKEFIVGLRLPCEDFMPDGQGPHGFAEVAKVVEAAGLDYVALSAGSYEAMHESAPSTDGWMVDSGTARIFADALSVPVLIQGIHDPARAANALAEGNGDMIMLSRSMLADPDYARKVAEDQPKTIVECVRDNYCMRRMVFGMPVRCEVNPRMGRESRAPFSLPPLERVLHAPGEEAFLKLTGSEPLMNMVGAVLKAGAKMKKAR